MELKYKFRALTKDNKEWIYGLPMYDYRCVGGKSESVLHIQEFSNNAIKLKYEIIPETLSQYTGLKDKNGKEIYAGDILESILEEYDNLSEKVYVAWCEDGYWGVYENPNHLLGMLRSYACGNYADIGNIYDNPELLQEVDK